MTTVCLLLLGSASCFFFFKQKTAYELRISDWSSDVCSSDLRVVFRPVGEALLDEAAVQRFRSGYRAHFGAEVSSDPVYEAVSAGQRYAGMEHWLPLDRKSTRLNSSH